MFAALVPDIHRVPAERGVEVFQVIARPPTYPPTWDYLPVCKCINIIVNFMIICSCQIGKNVCFDALACCEKLSSVEKSCVSCQQLVKVVKFSTASKSAI